MFDFDRNHRFLSLQPEPFESALSGEASVDLFVDKEAFGESTVRIAVRYDKTLGFPASTIGEENNSRQPCDSGIVHPIRYGWIEHNVLFDALPLEREAALSNLPDGESSRQFANGEHNTVTWQESTGLFDAGFAYQREFLARRYFL